MTKWQWIRISLGAVLLVITGTYLLYQLIGSLSKTGPDYAAIARDQGVPIVRAIEQFHADRGLWPEYLDDLAPQYAAGLDLKGWDYTPDEAGGYLEKYIPFDREALRYNFDPAIAGWYRIDRHGQAQSVPVPVATTRPATTLPAERVLANMLAELDRRIAREKTELEHYRMKASVLVALGRYEAACATLLEARYQRPFAAWPRLALTALPPAVTARVPAYDPDPATTAPATAAATAATAPATGPTEPVAVQFTHWVGAHESFINDFHLAVYYRDVHEPDLMLRALAEGIEYPVEISPADFYETDYYVFDAARMAYQAKAYDLVLEIDRKWEARGTAEHPAEGSYLALRAAALLAKGDTVGATAAISAALARNAEHPLHAKNLSALQQAIAKGETAFAWDPGRNPPPYEPFLPVALPTATASAPATTAAAR